jgi:hypothetical protein
MFVSEKKQNEATYQSADMLKPASRRFASIEFPVVIHASCILALSALAGWQLFIRPRF